MFDTFLKNLEKLLSVLGFCSHKWAIHDTILVSNLDDRMIALSKNPSDWEVEVGTRYHLRCEKCGDIKSKYVGA